MCICISKNLDVIEIDNLWKNKKVKWLQIYNKFYSVHCCWSDILNNNINKNLVQRKIDLLTRQSVQPDIATFAERFLSLVQIFGARQWHFSVPLLLVGITLIKLTYFKRLFSGHQYKRLYNSLSIDYTASSIIIFFIG